SLGSTDRTTCISSPYWFHRLSQFREIHESGVLQIPGAGSARPHGGNPVDPVAAVLENERGAWHQPEACRIEGQELAEKRGFVPVGGKVVGPHGVLVTRGHRVGGVAFLLDPAFH